MSKKDEAKILDASDALCAQIDPELWFPIIDVRNARASYEAANYAKSICARCPLLLACLNTALVNKEEYGIWGGASPNERKRLKTKAQVKEFIVKLQSRAADLGSLNAQRKRLR